MRIDEELHRLRRLTVRILLGSRAGSVTTLRSFLRFLAFHGHTAGICDQGRVRDYLWVPSLLKGEDRYRRREIAPLRRVHVVIDVRDFASGADPRLLTAARLVPGLFLTMAGCELTFTVWGNRNPFPVQKLHGAASWPWLGKVTTALGNLDVAPTASAGALRRQLSTEEPAHVVLVTNWLEPAFMQDLIAPLGGTLFLVEPQRPWTHNGRVGSADPGLVLLPSAVAEERDRSRIAVLRQTCLARRIDVIQLERGDVLEDLENQLS